MNVVILTLNDQYLCDHAPALQVYMSSCFVCRQLYVCVVYIIVHLYNTYHATYYNTRTVYLCLWIVLYIIHVDIHVNLYHRCMYMYTLV